MAGWTLVSSGNSTGDSLVVGSRPASASDVRAVLSDDGLTLQIRGDEWMQVRPSPIH